MKRTELRKIDGPPPKDTVVVLVWAESGRVVNVALTPKPYQRSSRPAGSSGRREAFRFGVVPFRQGASRRPFKSPELPDGRDVACAMVTARQAGVMSVLTRNGQPRRRVARWPASANDRVEDVGSQALPREPPPDKLHVAHRIEALKLATGRQTLLQALEEGSDTLAESAAGEVVRRVVGRKVSHGKTSCLCVSVFLPAH